MKSCFVLFNDTVKSWKSNYSCINKVTDIIKRKRINRHLIYLQFKTYQYIHSLPVSVSQLLVILSVVSTLKQTQDTKMSIIMIMTETSYFVDS